MENDKERIINVNSDEMPGKDIEEFKLTLKQIKNNKAGGEDNILQDKN